jgi:phage terminase Nu1 subunit (DNA packaging protein)
MAAMLGISVRAVRELAANGVLVRAPQRGHYLTLPSLHGYHDRLRNQAAGRGSSTVLADERAKREAVEREIAEINLGKIKGEVLTLVEVTERWTGFAGIMKRHVLALPSKLRQTIPHMTAHDQETARQLVYDLLNTLADEIEAGLVGADPAPLRIDSNQV